MVMADGGYKFVYINVGSVGRISDDTEDEYRIIVWIFQSLGRYKAIPFFIVRI